MHIRYSRTVLTGLVLAACSGDVGMGPVAGNDFEYNVTAGRLSVSLTITNEGSDSLVGTAGRACSTFFRFRVFLNPDRSGKPIWDSDQRTGSAGSVACSGSENFVNLAPGESTQLGQVVGPVAEIMAGYPPGTFYISARMEFSDPKFTTREFPAGQVELPGGQ